MGDNFAVILCITYLECLCVDNMSVSEYVCGARGLGCDGVWLGNWLPTY